MTAPDIQTTTDWPAQPAHAIAAAVRAGRVSALQVAQQSLAQIARSDGAVNAFTAVTAQRALASANALDARLQAGDASVRALPLLGVPYAVKNLFDVQGLATRAGSRIERDSAPASADGPLLRRLDAAGAVLVGALNMDEYAYGFTTENSHDGPTRNPHDLARVAGGSSGGSAAAVAAGQVPLTLGSDTNGSIRVPASLCGVFGLKPTYGRLPRNGTYPFVASLDHLGPFARSAADLALAYDALQGHDAADPGCAARPREPTHGMLGLGLGLGESTGPGAGAGAGTGAGPGAGPDAGFGASAGMGVGVDTRAGVNLRGLRIARLGGYFDDNAGPDAQWALRRVAQALGDLPTLVWDEAAAARAAAFIITNAAGGALHLPNLRRRAHDFEPLSRDRFLAGALLPAAWVAQAQRVRRHAALRMAALLQQADVLIAPATPVVAPPIGTEWLAIGGRRLPARPSLGLLAQPLSCIGLPVCTVPVWRGPAALTDSLDAPDMPNPPRLSHPPNLHNLPHSSHLSNVPHAPNLPIGVQIIAAPWREDLVLRVAHALEQAGVCHAPVARLS